MTTPTEFEQHIQIQGELFEAGQLNEVFPDSKTFVDCIPVTAPETILDRFQQTRDAPDFDLRQFVTQWFQLPETPGVGVDLPADRTMEEHLELLWDHLTVTPDHSVNPRSTLLALPYSYVQPGGRFREIYYWDTYFTSIGLARAGRFDTVVNMANNFVALIDQYGFIPNGNRLYYLGRSQPPIFSLLVQLIARESGIESVLAYLPALDAEHDFWMRGADDLSSETPASHRVVQVGDGQVLNRYWDDHTGPRPEAYHEDVTLAEAAPTDDEGVVYRNVRAACESGWDFSSRWLQDPNRLETIRTTELLPVDLNAFLYGMESLLAEWFEYAGNAEKATQYETRAAARRDAFIDYCWDPDRKYFFDYCWTDEERTDVWSLAGVVPVYAGLASEEHVTGVAETIRERFLYDGGLPATLTVSGQQWDKPLGWAPLHWMAVRGLARYGHRELARTIATRWLSLNRRVFQETGVMLEKYDVVNTTQASDAGEYPLQDGFGWTNGVAVGLLEEYGEAVES